MRRILEEVLTLVLLAVGLVSGPTLAAAEAFEVPFTTGPRGHLVVRVSLNGGRELPFVLDTGAGRTVLNKSRIASLGLIEQPVSETVEGAHGAFEMGLTEPVSLAFAGLSVEAVELATMELSHVESADMEVYGVLGFDIFGQWDLALDLENETASFHPRADSEASCAVCTGEIVVPFELVGGTHIRFEVTIDDQPIASILDTGSGRTGMNYLAAKAIGVDLPPSPSGAHGPALQVGEISLGDAVLARDLIVGVVDLPAFASLGLSEGPAMLVGTGALVGRRIGIAYGLRKMSVSTARAGSD